MTNYRVEGFTAPELHLVDGDTVTFITDRPELISLGNSTIVDDPDDPRGVTILSESPTSDADGPTVPE